MTQGPRGEGRAVRREQGEGRAGEEKGITIAAQENSHGKRGLRDTRAALRMARMKRECEVMGDE